ncbi:ankyrin repeat domain-containing protein [Rubrivirga sp. IMCC43871]|uniref:ankyrin repeat domain-containing protein n=1 Tax=Rubrivirga sp. IMCC43871 TaxID=3391575 RepID=UPI00398FF3AD
MTDAHAPHLRRLGRAIEQARTDEERARLRLERALWSGDVTEVLDLLGARHPDEVTDAATGDRPIHHAIGIAPAPGLRALIARGADVDYVADDGFPALLNAIHHTEDPAERRAVVRVLIDAGADLERVGHNGWRPLHVAALTDDPALVRMLLDAGADAHAKTTVDDRWTATEEAEEFGKQAGAEAIRAWLAER